MTKKNLLVPAGSARPGCPAHPVNVVLQRGGHREVDHRLQDRVGWNTVVNLNPKSQKKHKYMSPRMQRFQPINNLDPEMHAKLIIRQV